MSPKFTKIINYRAPTDKMAKKLFSIVFLALLCAGMSGQQVPSIGAISGTQAHNVIWESKLYRQVEFLSDSLCGGRATGTRGGTETAFWLIRRFRQLGLTPINGHWSTHFYEPFGRNVIGFLPGASKRHNDSYVIVMAHYDGLGTLNGTLYPGADSNASGVVAMVSVAEMFCTMRNIGRAYDSNIIFVGLDAKAASMKGSRALWKMIEDGLLTDPVSGDAVTADKIRMVVNIDQIGGTMSRLKSGRKDFIIMLGREAAGDGSASLLSTCNLKYGTGLELGYDYFGSNDFTDIFYRKVSDQRVFLENGIPSVMFTSGITMNNNKPYDSVDTIDMSILKRRIWLIFHWLERIM